MRASAEEPPSPSPSPPPPPQPQWEVRGQPQQPPPAPSLLSVALREAEPPGGQYAVPVNFGEEGEEEGRGGPSSAAKSNPRPPPSPSPSPSPSSPPPSPARTAQSLRRASRLVHCLQRERGSSTAVCASATTRRSVLRPSAHAWRVDQVREIGQRRKDVDFALGAMALHLGGRDGMERGPGGVPVARSIAGIRRAVDAALAGLGQRGTGGGDATPLSGRGGDVGGIGAALRMADAGEAVREEDEAGVSFHSIILMFNSLIAAVIKVYTVEECRRERNRLERRSASSAALAAAGGGSVPSSPMPLPPGLGLGLGSPPASSASSLLAKPPPRVTSLFDLRSLYGGAGSIPGSDPVHYADVSAMLLSTSPTAGGRTQALSVKGGSQFGGLSGGDGEGSRWGPANPSALLPPLDGSGHAGSGWRGVAPTLSQSGMLPTAAAAATAVEGAPPPGSRQQWELHRPRREIPPPPSGTTPPGAWYMRQPPPPPAPPQAPPASAQSRAASLFSLLISFAHLKESTGIERSVLSSLMALGSEWEGVPRVGSAASLSDGSLGRSGASHGSSAKQELRKVPKMLFSDLVLEEENQRRIVRQLQRSAHLYRDGEGMRSLLILAEESVVLTPTMERIQDTIRRDFDLAAFHEMTTVEEFFSAISVYMDRLHATELLLIEELECCLDEEGGDASGGGGTEVGGRPQAVEEEDDDEEEAAEEGLRLQKALMGLVTGTSLEEEGVPVTADEVAAQLRSVTPDRVKECLQNVLANFSAAPLPSPPPPPPAPPPAQHTPPPPQTRATEGAQSDPILGSGFADDLSQHPPHSDWDIDPYEIEFRKRIGRGVAGTTYLATWSGQPVAVKIAAITDMGIEGWRTECDSLQRLHHPNIVRMLGSMFNPNPRTFGLVLEYCEAGDLGKAFREPTPSNFFWKVAGDIANGMAYLHKKGIIHRDLKPGNVLLHGDVATGSYTAKLADFGVATMTQNRPDEGEYTAETGTYRWMAPEVIRHESYTFSADVFSYALVAWQLLTREEPFAGLSQIEAAGKVALELARPPLPPGTPGPVSRLIRVCWSESPADRIPFERISQDLQGYSRDLTSGERTWMDDERGHPVYQPRAEDDEEDVEEGTPIDIVGMMSGQHMSDPTGFQRKRWGFRSKGK